MKFSQKQEKVITKIFIGLLILFLLWPGETNYAEIPVIADSSQTTLGQRIDREVTDNSRSVIGLLIDQGLENLPLRRFTSVLPIAVFLIIFFSFVLFKRKGWVELKNNTIPDHSILYDFLMEHFDLGELKLLCFRLDIDFENIKGETKSIKVLELIKHCKRHGQFYQLIEWGKRERPNIIWPF